MRGQKELHDITAKDMPKLFSNDQLKILEKRGITLEAYYHYQNEGVEMRKCSQCKFWANVRALSNFTQGLMDSCVPCNFEQKTID